MNCQINNASTGAEIKDGTAEELLIVPVNYEGCPTDAVHAAISRSQAILKLIEVQLESGGDKVERLADHVLLHALWGVQGELGLIGKMVDHVG